MHEKDSQDPNSMSSEEALPLRQWAAHAMGEGSIEKAGIDPTSNDPNSVPPRNLKKEKESRRGKGKKDSKKSSQRRGTKGQK